MKNFQKNQKNQNNIDENQNGDDNANVVINAHNNLDNNINAGGGNEKQKYERFKRQFAKMETKYSEENSQLFKPDEERIVVHERKLLKEFQQKNARIRCIDDLSHFEKELLKLKAKMTAVAESLTKSKKNDEEEDSVIKKDKKHNQKLKLEDEDEKSALRRDLLRYKGLMLNPSLDKEEFIDVSAMMEYCRMEWDPTEEIWRNSSDMEQFYGKERPWDINSLVYLDQEKQERVDLLYCEREMDFVNVDITNLMNKRSIIFDREFNQWRNSSDIEYFIRRFEERPDEDEEDSEDEEDEMGNNYNPIRDQEEYELINNNRNRHQNIDRIIRERNVEPCCLDFSKAYPSLR
jgi:hypothetical protein